MSYVKIENERFIIDMMYARNKNMVQKAVYQQIGWGNLAVVHEDLWRCLEKTIPVLKQNGLKMKIFDAYRPPLAHDLMHAIVPMPGFFAVSAERSQHCHATAVDVCLCHEDGRALEYPTLVDAYHPKYAQEVAAGKVAGFKQYLLQARHDYQDSSRPVAIENREYLRHLMEDAGFESIAHEWWHYDLPDGRSENYPLVELKAQDFA